MARLARQIVPHYPHHLVQRGHDRRPCFFIDRDRERYLYELRTAAREHACAVHAYVLMTNHIHIVATPNHEYSLSAMMKQVNQRYVRYVNRRLNRTGTLWEGRFKSSVVDSDAYIMACYRYVELNPVRAGMVSRAAQYPWSSHLRNAGLHRDPVVRAHPAYVALGGDERTRTAQYAGLFEDELDDAILDRIRLATNRQHPLGAEDFVRRIGSLVGVDYLSERRGGVRKGSGRPPGIKTTASPFDSRG